MTLAALVASWAKPVVEHVPGAPYQVGDCVVIVCVCDDTVPEENIGKHGEVIYLEYSCGSGQTYPGDPMIGVRLETGAIEEFWIEELQAQVDHGGGTR